jgi:protein-L-isoaspartate(D-aspartate) O-methyltransferase
MEQSRAALSAVDALGDTAPVLLHLADGTPGLPAHGPYDRIHVACAAEHLPTALLDQLAPGGRLVAPVGPQGADQQLLLVRRSLDGCLTDEHLGAVRFVPLIEEQP